MNTILNIFLVFSLAIGFTSFDLSNYESQLEEQTTQWVMIGKRVVDIKADHDEIPVSAKKGFFTKLKFKVNIAPILVKNIRIVFGNGESKNIPINRKIAAGKESQIIDLPGNKRVIKKIVMNYKSFPGYGRAVVVVWGKY